MKSTFWRFGEKEMLLKSAGISKCYFYSLLKRQNICGRKMAQRLEKASIDILGQSRIIPITVWLMLDQKAEHPAFRPKEV